jgi:hypothetical protein
VVRFAFVSFSLDDGLKLCSDFFIILIQHTHKGFGSDAHGQNSTKAAGKIFFKNERAIMILLISFL